MSESSDKLKLLRAPFAPNLISKLPKPTKAQTEAVKSDYKKGTRCAVCGTWHHPEVVHLDYVGHAALTDRLLEVDLNWSWVPMAKTPEGLPLFDNTGGLWIELTILGLTRIGYGHAADSSFKEPGSREKEVIGDALRNAAMRFGCALDLWHKGDLHAKDDDGEAAKPLKPNDVRVSTASNTKPGPRDRAPIENAWDKVQKKRAEMQIPPPNEQIPDGPPPIDYAEALPFGGPDEEDPRNYDPPAAVSHESGEYMLTFGKFKNKRIKDVDPDDLRSYIKYLNDETRKSKKQKGQNLMDIEKHFERYTGGQ